MVIPLRDDNPTRTRPAVTLGLIIACVVIYFALQPTDQLEGERFLYEYAAIPCEVTHGEPLSEELVADCEGVRAVALDEDPLFPDKRPYLAVLFSMFFHGSILHLGGNMLFLWIFGNNIEDRLGKVGYLAFYLVTGFAAAAAHILTEPGSVIPVVGASGAIAGVMGAYLVFFPHARILTIIPLFIFIQFVYLPAFVVLIAWFGLQFLTNVDSGVAVAAHIGGFVAGAAIALAMRPFLGGAARRRPPPDLDFGGFGRNPYR
ncbi:MAG: rhomboid family intramembrane serine protease [Actinomycetota bacterium]|nr:rhomboid family intramembrane serine protease [Actinomycetota bacterium]